MSFSTFSLRQEGAILRVVLSNPPINLMSFKMVEELFQLGGQLMTDPSVRVVVVDTADPDFFIAHFNIEELVASASDPSKASRYPEVNAMQALGLSWQALPQVTIAKVAGRCRGAGLEFILGLTMRFASLDAKFCAPEASGGFLACGGGTTRVAMAAGPGRALELLLSARDFSGLEAERYGLVNRALPAGELDAYVDDLAARLSVRSTEVVAYHREVLRRLYGPMADPMFAGFAAENDGFRSAIGGVEMRQSVEAILPLKQAREHELDLPATIARVHGFPY
ncbi:enoyl-CoA hydratase/isomerase family protein [Azospirillum sp. B510]|uniref:enoyl-CoA hydratase/isomerase family protein n=1 Tax=Azospirillum sp. (strain B510) TaxID=137722 RepID=UPI0002EA4495|nr:enoyl-CoA hydratase/isomerase family protein [Azospirillum sp. B510]